MNLRELAPYAIAILAAYLAWIVYRLIRLKKGVRGSTYSATDEEEIHSQILGGDSQPAFSSVSYDSRTGTRSDALNSKGGLVAEEPVIGGGFEALMEVRQLKRRFDELQASHNALEASVEHLREAFLDLQAASQVSPAYNDAVALARRGFLAETIAERCGISVAEAQLVAALSSNTTGEKSDE